MVGSDGGYAHGHQFHEWQTLTLTCGEVDDVVDAVQEVVILGIFQVAVEQEDAALHPHELLEHECDVNEGIGAVDLVAQKIGFGGSRP